MDTLIRNQRSEIAIAVAGRPPTARERIEAPSLLDWCDLVVAGIDHASCRALNHRQRARPTTPRPLWRLRQSLRSSFASSIGNCFSVTERNPWLLTIVSTARFRP